MNYELRIKNLVLFLIILGLILPSFSFTPRPNLVWGFAQDRNQVFGPPETLEGLKTTGLKALRFLPETLRGIWQEFLGVGQKVWNWLKNIWDSYIYPSFYNIWLKVKTFFLKEIEERKQIIGGEFKKEKEELKEELPEVTKSLWQRFKELIK